MDVRHFKHSGGVTLTGYATMAAVRMAVVDAGTGAYINEFPDGSGFIYIDMGRGFCDLYLAGITGTMVAPIYQVRLLPDNLFALPTTLPLQEINDVVTHPTSPNAEESTTLPLQEINDVITYPTSPNAEESTTYSVTVNNQSVFVEKCQDISYAHFSFAGRANIKVTVSEEVQSYTLGPNSYNIISASIGQEISFSLRRPRKLVLHKVNSLTEILFIFADPPEDNPPQLGDPSVVNIMDYDVDNTGGAEETSTIQQAIDDVAAQEGGGVLYFPSGLYRTRTLNMGSDVTMYLEGGARLGLEDVARVLWFQDVSNASLMGRGTIESNSVWITSSDNIELWDVILKPLPTWAVHIDRSDDVTIYNLKIIGYWQNGTDAFDPDEAQHLLIDNVFYYGGDDFVAIHAAEKAEQRDNDDINVRNSVTYSNGAACKEGSTSWNDFNMNITFENIDSITGQYGLSLLPYDGSIVKEVYFKNIRIEEAWSRMIDFKMTIPTWRLDEWSGLLGHIQDIYVQNLTAEVAAPASNIKGYDAGHLTEDVTLDNYYLEGDLVTDATEGGISTNQWTINLQFTSSNPNILSIDADDLYVTKSRPGTFTVSRTGDLSQAITVNYTIRGTAVNGEDYATIPTSVTIPAGASSAIVTISPIDTGDDEEIKTVFLSLENIKHSVDGYLLGPDYHAVINILKD